MANNKEKTDKRKILIVDDELDACQAIASYLRKRGFQAEESPDAYNALTVIKNDLPDLIILDVVMPKMDGFELLKILKNDNKFCRIPVIMLTVKSSAKYVEKGISLEADFYLPKPFVMDNLMDFINTVL